MSDTPAVAIEAYLTKAGAEARSVYEALRAVVRSAAPDADELVGYGMPGFKYRGKPLVYFGAWKQHCALYGLPLADFEPELAPYQTVKGTLRFPPATPLPVALLRKLVAARVAAIEAEMAGRKGRRRA